MFLPHWTASNYCCVASYRQTLTHGYTNGSGSSERGNEKNMLFCVEKAGDGDLVEKTTGSHIVSGRQKGEKKEEIMQWKRSSVDASCISRVIASQKKGETRFLLKLTHCCRCSCSSSTSSSRSHVSSFVSLTETLPLIAYLTLEHFAA